MNRLIAFLVAAMVLALPAFAQANEPAQWLINGEPLVNEEGPISMVEMAEVKEGGWFEARTSSPSALKYRCEDPEGYVNGLLNSPAYSNMWIYSSDCYVEREGKSCPMSFAEIRIGGFVPQSSWEGYLGQTESVWVVSNYGPGGGCFWLGPEVYDPAYPQSPEISWSNTNHAVEFGGIHLKSNLRLYGSIPFEAEEGGVLTME